MSSTTRVNEPRSPSSWFLPTLTACLPERSADLLHPASDHGVHRVAALLDLLPESDAGAFPPMPHPPEPSPPTKPCHASPQADSPSSFLGCEPIRPRGFAPCGSPLCPLTVSSLCHPLLSWASLPGTLCCRLETEVSTSELDCPSRPLLRLRPRRMLCWASTLRVLLSPPEGGDPGPATWLGRYSVSMTLCRSPTEEGVREARLPLPLLVAAHPLSADGARLVLHARQDMSKNRVVFQKEPWECAYSGVSPSAFTPSATPYVQRASPLASLLSPGRLRSSRSLILADLMNPPGDFPDGTLTSRRPVR